MHANSRRLRVELLESRVMLTTLTWAGGASGDFNSMVNWSGPPQQVPGPSDTAKFTNTASVGNFINMGGIQELRVNGGDVTFDLGGKSFSISQETFVAGEANASLTVQSTVAGGVFRTATGTPRVFNLSKEVGTHPEGKFTVDGENITWDTAESFNAYYGSSLFVKNGAKGYTNGHDVNLYGYEGEGTRTGKLEVTLDAVLDLRMIPGYPNPTSAGALNLGLNGTQLVDATIFDADVFAGSTTIGKTSGSATLTVVGGGHFENWGPLQIGSSGSGTLNIFDATVLTHGTADIGHGGILVQAGGGGTNSSGFVNVQGQNAYWSADEILVAEGDLSTGKLSITTGGFVVVGEMDEVIIGNGLASQGELKIDGSGPQQPSKLIAGFLTVGINGTGNVEVTNGGQLDTINSTLESIIAEGGAGTVTISGAGSSWESLGPIAVGGGGDGTLKVLANGTVTSSGANKIGADPNSFGEVHVDSAQWTMAAGATLVAGDPNLADAENALIKVTNGGTIIAPGGITLNPSTVVGDGILVGGTKIEGMARGAHILPGDAGQIATLTFETPTFDATAGMTLFADIDGMGPGSGHDLLSVVGSAQVGGVLNGNVTTSVNPWKTGEADYFPVLMATGGLSGEFDPLTGLVLPDVNSVAVGTPSSGMQFRWRVVYDTTDAYDADLYAENSVFTSANQVWTGNGTYDVILLIEETPLTDLVADAASPYGGDISFDYSVVHADVTSDFDIALFLSSDGQSIDSPGSPLDSTTLSGGESVGAYTIDLSPGTVSVGDTLIAWIDSHDDGSGGIVVEGQIAEANENNNAIILPQIIAEDASADEESGTFEFVVQLASPSNREVTIAYVSMDDTIGAHPADEVDDFAAHVSGTLTFSPGETAKTVSITLVDDDVYEFDETLTLELSNPENAYFRDSSGNVTDEATVTLTITDETDKPNISIGSGSGEEGTDTSITFAVSLSNQSERDVTLDFATANDTATAGSDYTATSGTVTFTNLSTSETISVPISDDSLDEFDETFFVNLSNADEGNILVEQGTGTITDDDPLANLSIGDVTVNESAGVATLTVSLSPESGKQVTVAYSTAADGGATYPATSGDDFTATTGMLTFAPGETSKQLTVPMVEDDASKYDEPLPQRISRSAPHHAAPLALCV